MPTHPAVRPLSPADVPAVEDLSFRALDDAGREYGFEMGTRDDVRIAWGQARARHIAQTDPDGCFVAEQDGEVTGVALAIRRGSLWFLSLLTVRGDVQGTGIGRGLIEAALAYGVDCPAAMICASPDPKALRRYASAGFALHPGYEASGTPDRSQLPADLGVRAGDWDRDHDFVEELLTAKRGEPYGPDLAWLRDQGVGLLIRDGGTPEDRACVTVRNGDLATLAGASSEAATRVLWAGLAEAKDSATVAYLLSNQQWAIDVATRARLTLKLVDTLCTRGSITPPSPYIPSGIFG